MNVSKAWRCEWSMAGCWLVYLGDGPHAFSLPKEMEREAKLLASAPELLAATGWAANYLDTFVDADTLPILIALRDAIATATANMITDDPADDTDDAADTLIALEDRPLRTTVRLEDAA